MDFFPPNSFLKAPGCNRVQAILGLPRVEISLTSAHPLPPVNPLASFPGLNSSPSSESIFFFGGGLVLNVMKSSAIFSFPIQLNPLMQSLKVHGGNEDTELRVNVEAIRAVLKLDDNFTGWLEASVGDLAVALGSAAEDLLNPCAQRLVIERDIFLLEVYLSPRWMHFYFFKVEIRVYLKLPFILSPFG